MQPLLDMIVMVNVLKLHAIKTKYNVSSTKLMNQIVNWRNGIEKDIDEVLQIPYIFLNATKVRRLKCFLTQGVTASNSDLEMVFGTSNVEKVSRIILEKGKEQISGKERSHQIEAYYYHH